MGAEAVLPELASALPNPPVLHEGDAALQNHTPLPYSSSAGSLLRPPKTRPPCEAATAVSTRATGGLQERLCPAPAHPRTVSQVAEHTCASMCPAPSGAERKRLQYMQGSGQRGLEPGSGQGFLPCPASARRRLPVLTSPLCWPLVPPWLLGLPARLGHADHDLWHQEQGGALLGRDSGLASTGVQPWA